MKLKYFIVIVILFAIVWRIFISFVNGRTQDVIKKVNYAGVITKIYQEPTRHNNYFFEICIEKDVETTINASWWWHSWAFANVGDSIIKPPDTLMIIIKKPDGRSQEFFYRSERP